MQLAFEDLRDQMLRDGTAAWLGFTDGGGFSCEMPFSWRSYPDDVVGGAAARPEEDVPPTVLVRALRDGHPHIGNGLLVTMQQPAPAGDIASGDLLATLNQMGHSFPGTTHSIGAWVDMKDEIQWVMYLPNSLAFSEDGPDLMAISRHILLTAAREALLARRALLPSDEWEPGEDSTAVGYASSAVTHGLAWGEIGENG
jgi:hypothetical protein